MQTREAVNSLHGSANDRLPAMKSSNSRRRNARRPHSLFAVLASFVLSSIVCLSTSDAQVRESNSAHNSATNTREEAPCDTGSSFVDDTKAATSGDRKAMYVLGCRYEYGDGTGKDLTKAMAWYGKSADAGSIQGMNRLGEMYRDGDGISKDNDKASVLSQRFV